MNTYDAVELGEMADDLREAMEQVDAAMELVRNAIQGTENAGYWEAYLLDGPFAQLLGNGNPYDASIPKLIDELDEAAAAERGIAGEVEAGI